MLSFICGVICDVYEILLSASMVLSLGDYSETLNDILFCFELRFLKNLNFHSFRSRFLFPMSHACEPGHLLGASSSPQPSPIDRSDNFQYKCLQLNPKECPTKMLVQI